MYVSSALRMEVDLAPIRPHLTFHWDGALERVTQGQTRPP
jgi:hypothetical protein